MTIIDAKHRSVVKQTRTSCRVYQLALEQLVAYPSLLRFANGEKTVPSALSQEGIQPCHMLCVAKYGFSIPGAAVPSRCRHMSAQSRLIVLLAGLSCGKISYTSESIQIQTTRPAQLQCVYH